MRGMSDEMFDEMLLVTSAVRSAPAATSPWRVAATSVTR